MPNTSTCTDETLRDALNTLAPDKAAIAILECCREKIQQIAYSKLKDWELGRDVFQDVAIAVLTQIRDGSLTADHPAPLARILTISRFKAIDIWRKGLGRFDDLDVKENPAESPLGNTRESKQDEVFKACLEKIGDPCRELHQLHYVEGKSWEEVAQILNRAGAASARTTFNSKCLPKIKKCIEDSRNNDPFNDY